jgi:hypothetical protein
MLKKVNKAVKSYLLYTRNATIIISVFITIFYLFAYFMNRDKVPMNSAKYEQSRLEMYEFVKNPDFQKNDISKSQLAVYRGFLCYTIGETCTDNPKDAEQYVNNSLVTKASNIFVAPYANPPASGMLWTYESLQKSGFVPQTYAQGIGFYSLQPLAPIWKVFRNVAYFILVIIVVSIGFMIMFRANINPQAVITIENTIPRIVLALILITFSFPIAGFLIDVMYLLMGLAGSVVVQNIASTTGRTSGDVANSLGWSKDVFNSTSWELFSKTLLRGEIWQSGNAILSIVPLELQFLFRSIISIAVIAVLNWHPTINGFITGKLLASIPFIGEALAGAVGGVVVTIIFGLLVGVFFPVILSGLVFITALFLFFRIFFLLFITYTKILLSIIFAPIILMFEAFPERSTFGYWFKGLFFNLLTFPIVATLLLTAGMIASVTLSNGWTTNALNLPPSPTHGELWRPPFLYAIDADGFVMLIAVSIIFLIPDMVAFIKKTFGVEDLPFNITPGKLLGGSGAAVAGATGLFFRARSLASEFGITQEKIAASSPWNVFKPLLPENPYAKLGESLNARKNDQVNTAS